MFFHRKLVARLTSILTDSSSPPADNLAEVNDVDPVRGDRLASDTLDAVRRIRREGSADERRRVVEALASYTRGRDAFEDDKLDDAHAAFTRAENELTALHVPFGLLARDQRIRVQCSKAGQPQCLEELQALRTEALASSRYPWLAARTAYAHGQALYRRGRIYEAAEWFQRGQDEVKALRDPTLEGLTHSMLANAYAAAGETDVALDHYLAALRQRSEHVGDRRRRQLEDIVMFALRHDFIATSELLLDEMRSLPSNDAGRVLESTLRGIAAARRGDTSSAAAHFAQSHRLLELIKDPDEGTNVRRSLAIAEAESQLPAANMEQLDASIREHENEHFAIWLPQLLANRGALFEVRNEPENAERDYRRAIDILEHREPRIDQSVLSLGVASKRESPFDRLIRLLLGQKRIVGALSIAERASMMWISSLHARGVGVRDVFDAAHRSGDDGIAAMQRMLDDKHVVVVQYLLRDEIVTWIITSREIHAMRRAVGSEEIIAAAENLRACVANGDCNDDGDLRLASDALITDWIARVPRDATLLIQPPSELQAVPFAVLKTGDGELLLTRNAVATAPSLRAFVRAATLDATRSGEIRAFFAAAPSPKGREHLPLAADEVTRASQFYPATVLIHTTRAMFLAQAPSFSIVHFAGHVIVNDEQPLRSAMVFDPGDPLDSDLLQMHELDEKLFTNARLVVLSGCETGRAPRPTMSIANALLSQSVPSVVYTSWPVDDEAAEEFAIEFHRAIAAGRSRADAVRDAALAMFKKNPDKPNWWAAFALAGADGPLTH